MDSLTLRIPNAQVHHSCRQVSCAAAPTQVRIPYLLRVKGSGQRRGEVQVTKVRQRAACVQRALVVRETSVLLWRWEYTVNIRETGQTWTQSLLITHRRQGLHNK